MQDAGTAVYFRLPPACGDRNVQPAADAPAVPTSRRGGRAPTSRAGPTGTAPPLLRALLARKRVRLACARVLEGGQRSASVARTCLLNLLN